MNANELADALDWVCENHLVGIGDADFKATATMLRQQQAEIEELGSELDRAVELYTDKAIENEALHRFIDERGETGQLIIWKAQEK